MELAGASIPKRYAGVRPQGTPTVYRAALCVAADGQWCRRMDQQHPRHLSVHLSASVAGGMGRLSAKEELSAVREALSKNPKPQRSDIDRIRWSRRQEIALSDMEPPKVEPFEFFIIPDSTEAAVEPIAVGSYDPNTGQMEVAMWNEVKNLLEKQE